MGTGFQPHSAQTLTAAAVTSAGTVVFPETPTVAAEGTFSLTVANVLVAGMVYNLAFYVDGAPGSGAAGGNEACDPSDHQWCLAVNGGAAITGPVTVTDIHNPAAIQSVCASFSASSSGGGNGTTMPVY